MSTNTDTLFPVLTRDYILAFQFSSWYPIFAAHSIKSTIIRPLTTDFREYLNADGVFVPEGSEDAPAESTLSDDEQEVNGKHNARSSSPSSPPPPDSDSESDSDEDEDSEDTRRKHYAFPELDVRIRELVKEYGGIFPKLNFTSPRDAVWLLPASSPLKCTSPADVYLLLKSSDFITHDLNPEAVFEGAAAPTTSAPTPSPTEEPYELELVLRKWYPVDRGRELRCFVRDGVLLAISQRDNNFYEFWNEPETQDRVRSAVYEFWETTIAPKWPTGVKQDYIFDFLLTRDLSRGHIIDFNPYAPKTDPLLFSYEELAELSKDKQSGPALEAHARADASPPPLAEVPSTTPNDSEGSTLPILRVIDSAAHPAATNNAPAHQHNMVPFEAISLSTGRDIEEFADKWQESVREGMRDD